MLNKKKQRIDQDNDNIDLPQAKKKKTDDLKQTTKQYTISIVIPSSIVDNAQVKLFFTTNDIIVKGT